MSDLFSTGIEDHTRLLAGLRAQVPLLQEISAAVVAAMRAGRRVYVFGNGGSAADAQHIAAELLGRFRLERRALPAIALTTDTSTLLAVANDLGYDRVFSRQVEALVQPGDIVWALSTSGNSPNILEGVRVARDNGARIIGFAGRGGKLKPLCDWCLCVDHDTSDRIQEIHQIAYHLICHYVEAEFAGR